MRSILVGRRGKRKQPSCARLAARRDEQSLGRRLGRSLGRQSLHLSHDYLSIVVYCPWNCSRNGLAFIASPLRDPGELMTVQSGRLVCLNESKEGPANPDLSRFARDGLRRIPDYPARDRTTPMVPRPFGSPPASTSHTRHLERSTGAASTRLL
jgi:hypothetical protein